jgi:hypothetical protein
MGLEKIKNYFEPKSILESGKMPLISL